MSDGRRSYPQPGPPGNDRVGLEAIHDDQLLTAGRARHKANGSARDAELVRDELEERLVRRPGDGGRRHVGAKNPVDDALDMVGPRSWSQTDGEADVGVSQDSKEAPEDAQHDEDDEG